MPAAAAIHGPHRLARSFAGRALRSVAMTFAAFLFVTSTDSSAQASCGDYVTVHGHASPVSGHAPRSDFDSHHSSNPRPFVPPCDSPACRGQNPLPATPPAAPNHGTNGPQEVAMLLTSQAAVADVFAVRLDILAVSAMDGHRQRQRRPPRP
jgi:hypothetical protein